MPVRPSPAPVLGIPAVATALAVTLGGPGAAGIPIYSAVLLLALGAVFGALNRRKAR